MSEVDQEMEVNPVAELIDQIAAQDFNKAQVSFTDLLADRMQSALEAEKTAVAQTIYNEIDDSDLEDDEEDLEFEDEDEEETEVDYEFDDEEEENK